MKEYSAKTIEEAVKLACDELSVDEKHLVYEVKEEKKSLFRKTATIAVYTDEDAAGYAEKNTSMTPLRLLALKSRPKVLSKTKSSKSQSILNATPFLSDVVEKPFKPSMNSLSLRLATNSNVATASFSTSRDIKKKNMIRLPTLLSVRPIAFSAITSTSNSIR